MEREPVGVDESVDTPTVRLGEVQDDADGAIGLDPSAERVAPEGGSRGDWEWACGVTPGHLEVQGG